MPTIPSPSDAGAPWSDEQPGRRPLAEGGLLSDAPSRRSRQRYVLRASRDPLRRSWRARNGLLALHPGAARLVLQAQDAGLAAAGRDLLVRGRAAAPARAGLPGAALGRHLRPAGDGPLVATAPEG